MGALGFAWSDGGHFETDEVPNFDNFYDEAPTFDNSMMRRQFLTNFINEAPTFDNFIEALISNNFIEVLTFNFNEASFVIYWVAIAFNLIFAEGGACL